jgi:5-methylcytosine-specific restriction endonuclease McrA
MIKHLYDLKKPCPIIKYKIELTEAVKKYILDNRVYKKQTTSRESITPAVRIACWNTHVGEDVGSIMCLCCKNVKITQQTFVCGHVLADANGGTLAIDNLRPICSKCNNSMRTMNMDEFIAQHQF